MGIIYLLFSLYTTTYTHIRHIHSYGICTRRHIHSYGINTRRHTFLYTYDGLYIPRLTKNPFLYNLQSMTKQNDVRADQLLKKLRSDPPNSFLLLTLIFIYLLTIYLYMSMWQDIKRYLAVGIMKIITIKYINNIH